MKTTYSNDFEKLLDEVAKSYLEDDPDLMLMGVDELENYLLGMWDGIQRYKRELTIIDGCEEVHDE